MEIVDSQDTRYQPFLFGTFTHRELRGIKPGYIPNQLDHHAR